MLGGKARCVIVMTILLCARRLQRNKIGKMKREYIQIRCSIYEKKLLKKRAALAGISLSEYLRATAFKINMVERITPEQLECYQLLVQYKNNFSRISNMFKRSNPKLSKEVQQLAEDIRTHLKSFKK